MGSFPTLPEWVELEHTVQQILTEQEIHGWRFDETAAWELTSTLTGELREAEESLRRQHPYIAGAEFTPKRNNRTQTTRERKTSQQSHEGIRSDVFD